MAMKRSIAMATVMNTDAVEATSLSGYTTCGVSKICVLEADFKLTLKVSRMSLNRYIESKQPWGNSVQSPESTT